MVLGNLSETKPQESGSGNAYNELRALIGNTAESVEKLRKEIGKENGETATIDPLQLMPVGYIYISSDPTSPAELFGGTWEALTDRVIVGAGGKYDVNSTGGSETHTLTIDEMPRHQHIYTLSGGSLTGDTGHADWSQGAHQEWSTQATGGSAAHNNMQPYIAKYMWERTA